MTENGSKTDVGFSAIYRKDVRPKVKCAVIYRHRNEHPVPVMCRFFEVSRSDYYNFAKRLGRRERNADIVEISGSVKIRQIRLTTKGGSGSGYKAEISRGIQKLC